MRAGGSTKPFMCANAAAGPMVEVHSTGVKTVAVDNRRAVREVRVVVVDDSAVVAPIESPMAPTPTKAAEQSNSETQPEINSRRIPVKSRIRIPTGEHGQRRPIYQP